MPLITLQSAKGYGFGAASSTAAGDYESIATVTLGSNSTRVIMSSIPQTYKHLQIRLLSRSTRSVARESAWISFNGDYDAGSGLYTTHIVTANETSSGGANIVPTQGGLPIAVIPAANASSGSMFGGAVIDIFDYTSTNKLKVVKSLCGEEQNGTGTVRQVSGVWRNTNAITSLAFDTQAGGDLVTYSSFAIYGIKG